MDSITEEVAQVITKAAGRFPDDPSYGRYMKALTEFKKMLADGLIKPRGNNLMNIIDPRPSMFSYNTPAD